LDDASDRNVQIRNKTKSNGQRLRIYKENYLDLLLFEFKSFCFRAVGRDRPSLYEGQNFLNLGCGPNDVPGMVNADFFGSIRWWRNQRKLEWNLDLRYPLNCEDCVFDGVFSEHVLEHLYVDEVSALLPELFRVMKNGAVMRISVPDLEKYVAFYLGTLEEEDCSSFKDMFNSGASAIRNITQNYLHRSVWDFEELKLFLEKAGFTEIERRRYRESADVKLCLDQETRAWESLYVEARKCM
jgi:predicted SAM-dependent methyltransferase